MDQYDKKPTESQDTNSIDTNKENEAVDNHDNKENEEPSTPLITNTNQTELREEQSSPTKKRGWTSGFIAGLIGGIIGAVIVSFVLINNMESNEETASSVPVSGEPQIVNTIDSNDEETATSIAEVSEAVVGVVNLQQNNIWDGAQEAGTGSGIIYKKEDGSAYVVTNQHVVDGAENIEIVLSEEERYPAQVLGEDPLTDLAVLKIDGENIDTIATLGSSDLYIGETVLAIGNPLGLEFANSVTRGIISGLNRSVPVDTNSDGQPDWITEVLQTDAAINPGNSGGALVNTQGEVVGINSMKIAQGAVEGIGFAIPIDAALPIMEQLETDGEVVRPLIGISTVSLYQVPPEYRFQINLPEDIQGGMVVANVEPNSPADQAGLQQFDVITKINGENATSILELRQHLYSENTIGETIEIEYIRDSETHTTDIILEQRTEENNAA